MHVALLGQAPKAVSALARHVQAERIVAETQRCLHMPGWHDRPRRGKHISPHGGAADSDKVGQAQRAGFRISFQPENQDSRFVQVPPRIFEPVER